MHNYKLIIEYDGKNFKGWQRQNSTSDTIQGILEKAIEKISGTKVNLIGAGRTDSGVSAYNQAANFKIEDPIDKGKFMRSLNAVLPDEITVKKMSEVPLNFHSRYSAKKREYRYRITIGKKSMSGKDYFRINSIPDFEKIRSFMDFVLKLKYFKALCRNKDDKSCFLCNVMKFTCKYYKTKREIIFTIAANRFLHSMVRAILGLALEIGRGKIILKNVKEKIKKGEKFLIPYLPANALFLNKIYY